MKRLFTVLLAAVALFSLSACASDAGASSSSTSGAVSQATSTPDMEPSDANTYEVGNEATLGDWSITVTSCDFKDKIANPSGFGEFTPDSGNKFISISASITNNGKQSATFLPSFATNEDVTAILNYNDGYEYQLTNLIGLDTTLIDSTMNPLTSKEGIIAFEAPDAVVSGTESLILVFSSGEQSVNFSLR